MKFMMKLAAIALVMTAGQTYAADSTGLSLAQQNACLTCHAVDKKIVGPAYKDIAAKYKGDKTAEAHLMDKIKKGGAGVWGQIPMPPNPQVKNDDLRVIVKWILALPS
jgi:cytochrome c